jgi:hypothetical protein
MVASVCVDCGKQCSSVRCRQCYRTSVGASAHIDRTCGHCGCTFRRPSRKPKANGQPRDANKYCSKDCFYAAVAAGRQPFRGRVFDVAARLADWFESWESQRPKPRKKTREDRKIRAQLTQCDGCGGFSSIQVREGQRRKFCSIECRNAWRGPRECSRCGVLVLVASACGKCHCNDCRAELRREYRRQVGREDSSNRKRCRKYGGTFCSDVKRETVFKRDKWTCHVCKRKCSKIWDPQNPRCATIDHHPIPLSRGGDHDWHNVRCCCHSCNSSKSNRWNGQQRLRLM